MMREMNPIYVILLFVVLLGALLYYLQGKETKEQEIIPKVKSSAASEKKAVKAGDYQAQYEREQLTKQTETEESISVTEKPEDDISELDGIGPKYMELLQAAGYTSLKSIAESNPEELCNKLTETNNRTQITKRPPTLSNIEEWIKAAGSKLA